MSNDPRDLTRRSSRRAGAGSDSSGVAPGVAAPAPGGATDAVGGATDAPGPATGASGPAAAAPGPAADASSPAATAPVVVAWSSADDWPELLQWAAELVRTVARDHPSQHVAVFVPDASTGGLRLAADLPGARVDHPEVIVSQWVLPIEGSVFGRVYRTGEAALVADVSLDADEGSFPDSRARSSVTVPVGPPGGVVAVINVEAPWIGAFSIRDVDRLIQQSSAALATVPERRVA